MEREYKKSKQVGLKSYLSSFTKEELIQQILELNKKYKDVKTYYAFSLNPNSAKKSEEVKAIIFRCFNPVRGYKLHLKEARKAVDDFKKLSPNEEALLDVMLYYVECGVNFTDELGDIDYSFYNNIISMFEQAGILYESMAKEKSFNKRAERITNDTSHIGWGFHDDLADIYYNYFK